MTRILVTPRSLTASPDASLDPLKAAGFELVFSAAGRQPSEDELLALLPGCEGWLAGVEPITARVLAAATALKVISRNGTGVDTIDLAAAGRHGVTVLTAPGANAASVAELALGLMLAGLRDIPRSATALKAGEWTRTKGREIGGSTIGLIGCGAVGRRVAEAVSALGARVLAYDAKPAADFAPPRFRFAELDAVIAEADVVSLHCPPLPDGTALLDAARLKRMKRGAGLVNTARAGLVDESALLDALNDGHVGWYATDVFAEEPPKPSPLLAHERVIATPHIGGFTAEGGTRAVEVAVANLIAALTSAD